MSRLYDIDFSGWADETAQLLAERRFEEIDLDALIEEVKDLAGRHRDAYRSFVKLSIEHLLKLRYAPEPIYADNERGWRISVGNARDSAEETLEGNASAARDIDEALPAIYYRALRKVRRENEDFGDVVWPEVCPWTLEQVLDDAFWPERRTQ